MNDKVFAEKLVGDGYAVIPENGNIYAPVSGTVETVFPTKHAIGIQTESGIEVLMHMGIDTVELQDEGFEVKVEKGQYVRKGDLIAHMDLEKLNQLGKDTTVMILVTNMDKVGHLETEEHQNIRTGQSITEVVIA